MAMTSPLRHPPAVEAPSRAALRKQRLLEMENEQRIEDAEALKFTEEQRLSLLYSFRHVKFEWSDLDGMRSMRRRYQSPPPRHGHTHCHPTSPVRPSVPHSPHSPSTTANTTGAFAVLTNARLASFNPNETICVRSAMPPCPSTPAPTSPASLATSLSIPPPSTSPSPTITSFTPPTITTAKTKTVRTTIAKPSALSTRRRRSPVKFYFP
ncbi:hypothetical protein FB45DRAFT_212131 [Roridomyces roridus]|uniref:Uncharacterized protein n=1 Tax=Roridomyces roridus TaxID=1738132 RepID=A0AAD7FXH4_9AGAR|nr:hypothetical protein FB45DRAFT_212131 [Roridomyces roridus]